MTNFLVYTGIVLTIVGCMVYIYGAIWYWRAGRSIPPLSSYRETLRVKFYHYRVTWWLMSGCGVILIFVSSLVA